MRRIEHLNLLIMLICLVAVGQMAQTIYVPTVTDIAETFAVPSGRVQKIMAAYLFTYGFSQLIYGPLSDRIGRRPVILFGMCVFIGGALLALFSPNLPVLISASAIQGLGTGVAGVMVRTMPRDLYIGTSLRYANSVLNMGILVSPLIAPMIGGGLASIFGWRVCYLFLLILCSGVLYSMFRYMPETRPEPQEEKGKKHKKREMITSFVPLLSSGSFVAYLLMLVGALAGVAVFEATSGVLMGDVLGLDHFTISILFILPIPAAFLGAWYAGRDGKSVKTLTWHAVFSCLLAAILMWLPSVFGVMNVWTLLIPAAVFFFGAGMLFPLATTGAMEPFPMLAGAAGALVGGLQNVGSGLAAWVSSLMPQQGQGSLGLIMLAMAIMIFVCWVFQSRRVIEDTAE